MHRPSRSFTGHCSHKVANDVIHNVYALRALTGSMVQYCLGCGQNGCAFRAGRDMVLKVSQHDGEAPIAEIVKGPDRAWPFLPIFHGAWIVPGSTFGRSRDVGITLREDLVDFTPDHPKEFVREATSFLKSATSAISDSEMHALRRDLTPALQHMTPLDAQALRMLADFSVWSMHYGLGFDLDEFSGSLSIANLGLADIGNRRDSRSAPALARGVVVIRDLGNFEPKDGALERLRRATMQRAMERS